MRSLIFTFPQRLTEDEIRDLGGSLRRQLPGVKILIVDGCSGVTILDLPDEPERAVDSAP